MAKANCQNISDEEERIDCKTNAREERDEQFELCGAVRKIRLEVCSAVGEDRYDPAFDPANFVDPNRIGTTAYQIRFGHWSLAIDGCMKGAMKCSRGGMNHGRGLYADHGQIQHICVACTGV